MSDLTGTFGPPPDRPSGPVTTAHALSLFHDELLVHGFTAEFAEQATLQAIAATISRYDLTVTPPQ